MTTLAAQLGTRPTSADPNTESAGFAARNSASTSSPTTSNTAFSTMVMTKMKTVTCNVCFTALLRMPPSPSWQWQWSRYWRSSWMCKGAVDTASNAQRGVRR